MTKQTVTVLAQVVRATQTHWATLNDCELLKRFTESQDQAAFTALVKRHSPMVLGVCSRVLPTPQDAEDACQAVFLILARKAATISWQASVANWLYTTARKIARDARRIAQRRSKREQAAAVTESVAPADAMSGRELLGLLDEELDKLPPRYRAPLVLCYLQGLTRDEAATRLGIPEATLKSQLERGRKKLGNALIKRGYTLGAALLVHVTTSAAGASSLHLTKSILATVNGSPSTTVATLAQGVAMNIHLTKMLLYVGVLVGAALAYVGGNQFQLSATDEPTKKPTTQKTTARSQEKTEPTSVRGTVQGPDGKPVAGAKIWLCESASRFSPKLPGPNHVASTDSQGQFTIERQQTERNLAWSILAATKEGYGIGITTVKPKGEDATTLTCLIQMAKDDVPIEGRIRNLQGKPVVGAIVYPVVLYQSNAVNLDEWEPVARVSTKRAQGNFSNYFPHSMRLKDGMVDGIPLEVKTDAEGRFTIRGLGRDRLVTLRVSGAGIASEEWDAVTRKMDVIQTPPDKLESQYSPKIYYGAKFDFVVGPSQPFVGTITDRTTGKPIPNVVVRALRDWNESVQARTDANGKYRLDGLPTGEQELLAVPPIDTPYFLRSFRAGKTANEQPVTTDLELYQGIWVHGTVTDKATGKPVLASISYRPHTFVSRVEEIPGYVPRGLQDMSWYTTNKAGQFRVLAVPGEGYVFIRTSGQYLSADQFDWQGDVKKTEPAAYTTSSPVEIASNWNAIGLVTAREAGFPENYTFQVDPGITLKVKILDPNGQPVSGAMITQRYNRGPFDVSQVDAAEVELNQVNPKRPRSTVVVHREKKLGLLFSAKPTKGDSLEIHLQPTASIYGRLVSEDGHPLANTPIEIRYAFSKEGSWRTTAMFPETNTDKDGKFVIANLVQGLTYELRWPRLSPKQASAYHSFTVVSGENKNLGDVNGKSD